MYSVKKLNNREHNNKNQDNNRSDILTIFILLKHDFETYTMETLDLHYNTHSTKMNQSNARSFIEQQFSIEFIEKAKMETFLILGQLYNDFSIDITKEDFSIPTEDFRIVNLCNGTRNMEVSELISDFLHSRDFTENEVLYITISFISNPKFQSFIETIRQHDEEEFEEEILKILVAKHIYKQLPLYVLDYLHASIIRFCSEFDISDDHIDNDTFDNMKTHYSSLLIK